MRMKRSFRASMENRLETLTAELGTDTDQPIVVEVNDVGLVPVEDIKLVTDVVEAQADTVDAVNAIDKLSTVAEQLETVHGNIAATIPNGGLTPNEAAAYGVATDAIVGDLGVKNVLPSMESFGGSLSRLEATQISMEAVGEVIKRVAKRAWDVLIELIQRIANMVKRLIARMFSDTARAKQLLEKLRESKLGTYTITVSVDGAVSNLMGGRALNLADVSTNLDGLEQLLGTVVPNRIKDAIFNPQNLRVNAVGRDVRIIAPLRIVEEVPSDSTQISNYSAVVEVAEVKSGKVDMEVTIPGTIQLLERVIRKLESKSMDNVLSRLKDITSNLERMRGKPSTETELKANVTKDEKKDIRSLITAYAALTTSATSVYADMISSSLTLATQVAKGKGEARATADTPRLMKK